MNAIEQLKAKYADLAVPDAVEPVVEDAVDTCEFVPGAEGWRGCGSVCLLSDYIRKYRVGAEVVLSPDNRLALRFRPVLSLDDVDRLRHACEVFDLLVAAEADIHRLMAAGRMRLNREKI